MIYKPPRYFLSSFESTGLSVQEKTFKIDFQDGVRGGHVGFLIGKIFYLQVISIISFKFQVNLLFSSGEEFQNIFFKMAAVAAILIFWSKWFSYFYLQVALILPTRFRVNWPFRSGEENNFKGGAKAVILDFRLKWYLLFFFIYKSPRYLLTSFESVGFPFRWRIQNSFSRWRLWGQLGFSIWKILASFYLQVISILLMKFRVNWPFR